MDGSNINTKGATAPFYLPQGDEVSVFQAAAAHKLPVLLKGPTGCGKTRFMEHMAWRLKRPLITVSCHDDLTASDLVGRYLVKGGETVWVDGPLTRAVRAGGICYLDEVVEAPLADEPARAAHDADGHRVVEPERVPDGHDRLGHPERARAPQRDHRKAGRLDLQQGQIGLCVAADDLR